MTVTRGAPAFWFVELFLDEGTLRYCNAFLPITFDGETYAALGDRMRPPPDIDRTASLKSQKFSIDFDSSRQTDNTDEIGVILDRSWKRRPMRARYAVGAMGAAGYDFSAPEIIADEAGRILDLVDNLSAGDVPTLEMEVESGALIFLERRNQTRSPANQKAAFPGDRFFDFARQLDGVVLPWRTKKAKMGSTQIRYDVEGVAPREMIIGRAKTRGSFVFGSTTSQHRSMWSQVYALADHQCDRLEEIWINGTPVLNGLTLVHGSRTPLSAFASGGTRLWVTWYDGRHDQAADSLLISETASQAMKWTSAHRGRGVSYVIIQHAWDSDNPEAFTYEFLVRGAKIYQERKDTTAGGSGAHRLDDPATWEWSTNPEEALRHYLRGRVTAPGSSHMWFGVGAPSTFLDPYSVYAARAAHCDGTVATLTGVQKRYEANGKLSAANDHATSIRLLADCMVARAVDEGGRISIRLSEPQTPVIDLTDDDLIEDEDSELGANARSDDVVNRIEGRYTDPANKYDATDYPAVENETFAEIDGESITDTWNQEFETNVERAQRKATLYLNQRRRTVELTEHFGPRAWIVRPGDWLTRSSDLRGFPGGKTFIAEEVRRFIDGTVRLVLLEVDPGELVWSEESAQIPDDIEPFEFEDLTLPVPSITLAAISVSGGDVAIPGVRFTNPGYNDFASDEILCQFGIWNGVGGGGMGIAGTPQTAALPGNIETFDALIGLLPGTTYAFRFLTREFERSSDYSAFQTLTMTGDYVAGRSAIADAIVGQGWGATASEAQASNARVPLGANALVDSEFQRGLYAWQAGWAGNSGVSHTVAINLYGAAARNYYGAALTGTPAAGTVFDVLATRGSYLAVELANTKLFGVPVNPGERIYAGAQFSGEHISSAAVAVVWVANDGSAVSSPTLGSALPAARALGQITAWDRIGGFATAPAGAAFAVIYFRATCSGAANPYCVVTSPMLARVPANQTEPPPYTPGRPDPLGDVTANGVAAGFVGQNWGATASEAAASNAALPLAASIVPNAKFQAPFNGTAVAPRWSSWDNGIGTFAASVIGGGYAFRVVGLAGQNHGILQTIAAVPGQKYLIAAEVIRRGGSFAGAGVLVQWRDSALNFLGDAFISFSTDANTAGTVSATPDGPVRFEKIAQSPAGTAYFQIYAMTHFGSFGSIAVENQIDWREASVSPVSLVSETGANVTGNNIAAGFIGQGLFSGGNYYSSESDPGAVPNGSEWFKPSTKEVRKRISGAWILQGRLVSDAIAAPPGAKITTPAAYGPGPDGNRTTSAAILTLTGLTGTITYAWRAADSDIVVTSPSGSSSGFRWPTMVGDRTVPITCTVEANEGTFVAAGIARWISNS